LDRRPDGGPPALTAGDVLYVLKDEVRAEAVGQAASEPIGPNVLQTAI
jgi:hypothetical protein